MVSKLIRSVTDNESDQVMEGEGSPGSGFIGASSVFNNMGWVWQNGNRNSAEQELVLGGGNTNNINNQAFIEQYNNDNDASQDNERRRQLFLYLSRMEMKTTLYSVQN